MRLCASRHDFTGRILRPIFFASVMAMASMPSALSACAAVTSITWIPASNSAVCRRASESIFSEPV